MFERLRRVAALLFLLPHLEIEQQQKENLDLLQQQSLTSAVYFSLWPYIPRYPLISLNGFFSKKNFLVRYLRTKFSRIKSKSCINQRFSTFWNRCLALSIIQHKNLASAIP